MGSKNVSCKWVSGNQVFYDKSGNEIYRVDGGTRKITVAAGAGLDLSGGASGAVVSSTVLFTEDATTLTHTGTVVIPAGATLLDIVVVPQVLWGAGTSAAFTCGDANTATGWFTSTNLKATDLLVGERLVASDSSSWGGVNGAYLVSATGRFGQQSANMIGGYCPSAYSVIGVVTVVGPSVTTGRTRMTVLYTIGNTVTPVLA